ncbi:hypothetical protein [Secundilactobacillus paracollinoides]|uniref:hypothetical protein n=1 Tax=Secundilactobacillus paracollinoides TaxID=240427 RepID=UPI000B0BEC0C|nr:hypothetical protein [Secundilactobacillus paracollinoides]
MTRVRIEIDDRLTDKEIVIRTPVYDADVKRLSQQLQAADKVQPQLRFFKGDTEYYLDVNDILFFETEDRQINAHTVMIFLRFTTACMNWKICCQRLLCESPSQQF